MSEDVNAVETSTTEEATVTEPVEVDSSAGTQNTATAPPQENAVPYSRFKEVNDQRKELAERIEALERQIRRPEPEPEPKKEPAEEFALASPPDHFSEDQRVAWLIAHHSRAEMEKVLGMPLEKAAEALKTSATTAKSYAEQKWQNICNQHGMDPANTEVQEMVAGLLYAGVSRDEAFKRAGKFYGKPAPPSNGNEPPVATVEDSTVGGVMTNERRIPRTAKEAVEMALKGQKAPHVSSQDIIQAAMKRAEGK